MEKMGIVYQASTSYLEPTKNRLSHKIVSKKTQMSAVGGRRSRRERTPTRWSWSQQLGKPGRGARRWRSESEGCLICFWKRPKFKKIFSFKFNIASAQKELTFAGQISFVQGNAELSNGAKHQGCLKMLSHKKTKIDSDGEELVHEVEPGELFRTFRESSNDKKHWNSWGIFLKKTKIECRVRPNNTGKTLEPSRKSEKKQETKGFSRRTVSSVDRTPPPAWKSTRIAWRSGCRRRWRTWTSSWIGCVCGCSTEKCVFANCKLFLLVKEILIVVSKFSKFVSCKKTKM